MWGSRNLRDRILTAERSGCIVQLGEMMEKDDDAIRALLCSYDGHAKLKARTRFSTSQYSAIIMHFRHLYNIPFFPEFIYIIYLTSSLTIFPFYHRSGSPPQKP